MNEKRNYAFYDDTIYVVLSRYKYVVVLTHAFLDADSTSLSPYYVTTNDGQ